MGALKLSKIIVNLLGIPEVYKDDKKIKFPFKKAEALFYYLMLKKVSSRDTLADLLWGDLDQQLAKKNLRNALYFLRRLFDEDIFISPKRDIVHISPEIEIILDIEEFLNDDNKNMGKYYRGDFLEGFYVKDGQRFEEWMIATKEEYREIYIKGLQKSLKEYIKEKDIEKMKDYCKKIIYMDNYNEKPYRVLMKIYGEEGKYDKAIQLYNKLEETIKDELSLSPDKKTVEVYNNIINLKAGKNTNCSDNEFFFGRDIELKKLNNNYNRFILNLDSKSLFIEGEAGIGKTRLVWKFLNSRDKNNTFIIDSICYQAEQEYLLKPWNNIFIKIAKIIKENNIKISPILSNIISNIFPTFDMNEKVTINLSEKMDMIRYQAIEDSIIGILEQVGKNKKIILFIDDIQWIDNMSLSILKSIMIKNKNESIMIIAASREGYDNRIHEFLNLMEMKSLISKIHVKRLNEEENYRFIDIYLSEHNNMSIAQKKSIYRQTEGNIFFLTEVLNMYKEMGSFEDISPQMQNILQTRLYNLSKNERRALDIISVSFDKVKFDDLKDLWKENDLGLIDTISNLQNKCLIKEILNGRDIEITFSHNKMREFVYSKLCLSEKIIIHSRMANNIERKLKGNFFDSLYYSRLIYHYENSGNKLKALKYTIENIDLYLQSYHEFIPVVYSLRNIESRYDLLNEEEIRLEFNKIKEAIENLKSEGEEGREFYFMQMKFLYMLGRNYIRKGNYEEGLETIGKLLKIAEKINSQEYLLKAYKQLIYYSMNTDDKNYMEKYVSKVLDIADRCNYKEERAIGYRLKGFQKVMEEEYEEGEKILEESINMFLALNDNEEYVLNIAAAYDSIGECNRRRDDFLQALKCYHKSIKICLDNGLLQGLPMFYVHAAQCYYELEQYNECETYIKSALDIYERMDIIWGRALANGIYALVLTIKNQPRKAIYLLNEADKYSNMLKNPYEILLLEDIRKKILEKEC